MKEFTFGTREETFEETTALFLRNFMVKSYPVGT